MLIPYSTDAPLYHYPISTVSLIVLNVLCFFAFCTEPVSPKLESLEFRDLSGKVLGVDEVEEEIARLEISGLDAEEYIDSLTPIGCGRQSWQHCILVDLSRHRNHSVRVCTNGDAFFLR